MSRSSNEIADEFFDKQELTTVDFEITFAALVGTAVLTYPIDGQVNIGQAIAFSLLILTLVRRMAITSPYAPEEKILSRTVPLISIVSTSAIIYLIVALLPVTIGLVSNLSSAFIFSVLTMIGLALALTIQELVFRDYFAWWHVKFNQKSEQLDLFENIWLYASLMAYWVSIARRRRESYRELGNRVPNSRPDLDDFEFNHKKVGRYVLGVSLLLGLLYLLPLLYALYLFGLQGLFVLTAVVWIHDHTVFWYIAYGTPSYEDLRQRVVTILVRTVFYITLTALLLSQLAIPIQL